MPTLQANPPPLEPIPGKIYFILFDCFLFFRNFEKKKKMTKDSNFVLHCRKTKIKQHILVQNIMLKEIVVIVSKKLLYFLSLNI